MQDLTVAQYRDARAVEIHERFQRCLAAYRDALVAGVVHGTAFAELGRVAIEHCLFYAGTSAAAAVERELNRVGAVS